MVRDEIEGETEVDVELVYQLAAVCTAEILGNAVHVSRSGVVVAQLTIVPAGDLTVSSGEERLDGGWVSPHFGAKVAAARISWRGSLSRTGMRTTILAV